MNRSTWALRFGASTYIYDAFGRLCSVLKRSGGATVTEYTYNGLGHRTSWHYDANVDGSVNGTDPTYYFCYDERWRIVATYRGSDANPKEQFIFHAGGLRGLGGSSYIDSVVCRDKDANSGWTSASDGTLEERRYYCQNWRSDVVCITDSSGDPQEWVRYSAYGVPFSIPKGDYNCDGVLDSNDTAALNGMVAGSPGFWTDFNQDGNVDTGDTSDLTAYITANSSAPGGRGKLSRGDGTTSAFSVGNRIGYAGYQFDPALAGSVWHVRNRVLVSELGRWTRRDPIGYKGGNGLYAYANESPLLRRDSLGLRSLPCVGSSCGGSVQPPVAQPVDPFPGDDWPDITFGPTCAFRPCLDGVLQDPRVRAALSAASGACAGHGGSVHIGCGDSGGNCQQQTNNNELGCHDAVVGLCVPGTCTAVDKLLLIEQIIHEVTHARQVCEQGCNFYSTCPFAVCAEIEAYCAQDPVNCRPNAVCGTACLSADTQCPNPTSCLRLCNTLFSKCKSGGNPFQPGSPPGFPAELPF